MNQNELKLFEKEFNSEKKIKRENEEITILKKIEKVLKNKNMNNFNQNYDKFQNIINENIENFDIFKNKKNQNQNVKNENEKKEEFKKIKFLQTKNELNSISNENENNNEWDNIMYKINNLTNTIQNCFNSNNIILINKNNNEKQIINKISNQNKENQNDDFTKDLYSILIEKTNKLNKIKQKLLLEKN